MELIGDCHAVLINWIFLPSQTTILKSLIKYICTASTPTVILPELCCCQGKKDLPVQFCLFMILVVVVFCSTLVEKVKWEKKKCGRLWCSKRCAYRTYQTTPSKASSTCLYRAQRWFILKLRLWSIKKCNKARMKMKSKAQNPFLEKKKISSCSWSSKPKCEMC